MVVYTFRTSSYAMGIYLYGNRRFSDIPTEYIQSVKEYAAKNFNYEQIDAAYANGYITEQECNDTIALKEAVEPRPVAEAIEENTVKE